MSKTLIDVDFEFLRITVFEELFDLRLVEGVHEVISFKELGKGSLSFFSSSEGRYFNSVYLSKMYIKNRVQ